MASIDGGHYFLTVLAPVRRGCVEGLQQETTAPVILLRERLATLPTAQQTPWSTASGYNSPFAKSKLTHFARFAVIDRLGYNGFTAADPIKATLGLESSFHEREQLPLPYLLFAAEFDAPSGSRSADLATYLRELWDVMEGELRNIFSNCDGFGPETIRTAADFIGYIRACEIETTMPFNYYWTDPAPLPTLTMRGLLLGAALAAALAGVAVWLLLRALTGEGGIVLPSLVGVLAGLAYPLLRIKTRGERRFPVAPDCDLAKVLKGLHLQNTFGKFVIANQLKPADELYRAFGDYLAANRVSDMQPAHPAGMVFAKEPVS